MVAVPAVAAKLQTHHRTVAHPAVQFVQSVVRIFDKGNPNEAESLTLVSLEHAPDLVIAWLTALDIGPDEHSNAVDAHSFSDLQHCLRLLGQCPTSHAIGRQMTVDVPDSHLR